MRRDQIGRLHDDIMINKQTDKMWHRSNNDKILSAKVRRLANVVLREFDALYKCVREMTKIYD